MTLTVDLTTIDFNKLHLTPTCRRLLERLKDGESHIADSLRDCLYDELGTNKHLNPHLTMLRRLIAHVGLTVISEVKHKQTYYRLTDY
jgi:hypothetical protein